MVKYVQEHLHRGYTAAQVAEHLRKYDWTEEDIEDALTAVARKHKQHALFMMALAGFVAFLVLGILLYFIVVEPAFVEKPVLERPAPVSQSVTRGSRVAGLGDQQALLTQAVPVIGAQHLTYVLTELGAYKLHENPFTGDPPEMEILVRDLQQTFAAIVENNAVSVRKGIAQSPDMRVEATQDDITLLSTASNNREFQNRAAQLLREREQRKLTGTLLTSKQDLVFKGYLALYGEHQDIVAAAGITGGAITELPLLGSGMIGMYVIVLVLWGLLLVRMRFGNES